MHSECCTPNLLKVEAFYIHKYFSYVFKKELKVKSDFKKCAVSAMGDKTASWMKYLMLKM